MKRLFVLAEDSFLQIHSLMYRLKNGEMPSELQPGAWWLMIGNTDITLSDCDIDAVVAGIVTIADEILRRDEISRHYGASHVVINSLFPKHSLEDAPARLIDQPLYVTFAKINYRLACYAATTTGVEFFNATDLFIITDPETGEHSIDESMFLLNDETYLSAKGLRKWEEAIVEKTLDLIAHND